MQSLSPLRNERYPDVASLFRAQKTQLTKEGMQQKIMLKIYRSSEYSYYFCTTGIGSTGTCVSPDTIDSGDVFDTGC